MNLVVVESPSKAKTINKYLGKDYHVLASFGHVRDLPSKDGSVLPNQDFQMTYLVDDDSERHIDAIAKSLKNSDKLILATDPDREGEAISWHVLEALKERNSLPKNIKVERVVFNEITKKAILEAMHKPRQIDMDLVNAQQARRALDYLVGFTLSPVLWRKLPGSKSAGRVQSVALRIICERDEEIEKFISQEYWDIKGQFSNIAGAGFKARLTHYNQKKLDKFAITNEQYAKEVTADVATKNYKVTAADPKQARRHPYPPFTTSTLQQDASRRLGFGAKKTMQLAQKLYEGVDIGGETVGLITYMRTDGVSVSAEAIDAARSFIGKKYGDRYLPSAPRLYKVKQKNAQEAHEAIRPTDVKRLPDSISGNLDKDLLRLYDLIWKRMVASQMESAIFDQMSVDLEAHDKQAIFHATGSVLRFDGFLTLYQETKDDDEKDEESKALPPLELGEKIKTHEITPEQHFTEPPPRYTEASLVRKLEELGIGRPSTYAAIISVLQERNYVLLDKKRFIAETRGRIVNAFLVSFFNRYVEYGFTASLEEKLDDVSAGTMDWKQVLREWWEKFIVDVETAKQIPNPEVLTTLDSLLAPYIYRGLGKDGDPRQCPTCADGRLGLKTGKFGAFLGCSNYPTCNYTKPLGTGSDTGDDQQTASMGNDPVILGTDPVSNQEVSLKKGPYGMYVQLGSGKTPKRASLPKGLSPEHITLEQAMSLLALPREVGLHPETGKMITASLGRFGPYLLHDKKYVTLKGDDDVLTIGINRAVTLIAESNNKAAIANTPLKVLGEHPEGGELAVYAGRYGNYVKHGKINASLPKEAELEHFTLADAIALLSAKEGSGKKTGVKKKVAAKPAAKKSVAKTTTAKKPVVKKAK